MSFDPAADPWGTAMLAAAVLWILSLLVLVAAFVAGTERRTSGRLMLVSLLAFLGSAAGGTWERIQVADEIASRPAPPPPKKIEARTSVVAGDTGDTGESEPGSTTRSDDATASGTSGGEDAGDESGSTGFTEEVGSTGSTEDDGSTGELPSDGSDDGGEMTDTDTDDVTEELPEAPWSMPQVDPLPSDPNKRKWAIIDTMRDAAEVADTPRYCARLKEVSVAWARLRQVPSTPRSRGIARRLEQCRRRLLYSASRRHRREQVEQRDEFRKELAQRLRDQGLNASVSISGVSHERLRIGSIGLSEAKADAMMDDGLRDETRDLNFARVAISDGTDTKVYEFEVVPDSLLGLPDLRAVGMGEPLEMPEEGE